MCRKNTHIYRQINKCTYMALCQILNRLQIYNKNWGHDGSLGNFEGPYAYTYTNIGNKIEGFVGHIDART
jgi:hypothetical protein